MYVIVALMLATQVVDDGRSSAPDPSALAARSSAATDEVVSLDALVDDVMVKAADPVRVAVPPVKDTDEARASQLQLRLVRALLDRRREEVVTPAMVARVLGDAGTAALAGGETGPLRALSADHVLLADVIDAGGEVRLHVKLLHVETGGVLAEQSALLDVAAMSTSARAVTVRRGIDLAVDQLADALAKLPGDVRYQRVAVAPLEAQGDAVVESRVDRFVQAELTDGLQRRGYLVAERAQLSEAMGQLSLAAQLGEADAPDLGKMLDAQAIVLGSISEAGDAFLLSLRVVSTEGGAVLGAADAKVPREGVVTLASDAIETRSAAEAFFMSAVAPGWGQFYNRQSVKGTAFAAATYGSALTTIGLGIGGAVVKSLYDGYVPATGLPPQQAGVEAKNLRTQANALFTATAIAAAVTAVLWSAGATDALLDGMAYE